MKTKSRPSSPKLAAKRKQRCYGSRKHTALGSKPKVVAKAKAKIGKSGATGNYNAIILDKEKKITGRILLKDLTQFPSEKWRVMYNHEIISSNFQLKKIPSGPGNPFRIFANETKEDSESESGSDNDVLMFHLRACPVTAPAAPGMSGWKGRVAGGASELRLKDFEGNKSRYLGYLLPKGDEDWMAFGPGFNVEGKCEYPQCLSRASRSSDQPLPILRFEYGTTRLTSDEYFRCPACKMPTFKPGNLLVSEARSALNFRKAGEIMGKSTLFGHLGNFPEYVTLDEGNAEVEYDVVEVKTVKRNESPFNCNGCHLAIIMKTDEVRKLCGHNFHKKCSKDQGVSMSGCPVCAAELIEDVDDIDNSSDSD